MVYGKAVIVNSEIVVTDYRVIDQSRLTSDCWSIQFSGLAACQDCNCMNHTTGKEKRTCGGKNIRKALLGR